MNKFISILALLLFHFALTAQTSIDENLIGFDEEVQVLLETYHAAGVAIAIVKDGAIVYEKGFGYRDFTRKLPVDQHTVFGIGSVTKSFTAALLGILEREGKLSLNDAPRKHIPELRFYNTAMDQQIRIRDILSHSTGIGQMSSESSCVLFQTDQMDDLIPRLAHLKPQAGVGESWIYSNYMYTVAGVLSERISGKSWSSNIQDLIFQPLGMNNSYVGAAKAYKDDNYSLGYAVAGNQPTQVIPEAIPSRAPGGDLYCSVHDMSKWANLWLNEGKHGDTQLLPTSYVDDAISPQQIMWGGLEAGNPEIAQFTNYGYGWMNSNFKGYYRVEHSGGTSGYTSNVVLFPKESLGLVILTNQTRSNLAYRITDVLVERLLDVELSDEEPRIDFVQANNILPKDTKTAINTNKKPSHNLSSFTGTYAHPGYGAIKVTEEGGTLYADFPFTTFRLEHVHYNVFQEHFTEEVPIAMWPFMRLNFRSNAEGNINSVYINFAEEPIEFRQLPKQSIADELAEVLNAEGKEAAIKAYHHIKEKELHKYQFSETEMNTLGYHYLENNEIGKAITIFELTVASHPESFNAYDSLGEGFMKNGDKEKAIENFKKSVLLNPQNQNGFDMLAQLGVTIDPSQLAIALNDDEAMITQTLMDYIEGTANGEADRIRRAFHNDLNLYAVGNGKLLSRSGQKYIGNFEDGKKRNRIGKIISIDYVNDAAIAKVEIEMPENNRTYTDYMMLLKLDGDWKIIHKSYTYIHQ